MHTLLVYLKNAPMEQQPAVASLLLQLDTLPRKMSIYREEAIDTLTDMLQKKDFPNLQLMALDALSSLSGKSYTQAWLLNLAGFNKPYEAFMENENMIKRRIKLHILGNKRVASVLCNHEKGVIFEALEQCLKSKSINIAKKCLVIATWLVYMLYNLPDTGVRDSARRSLLNQYIHILQSSRNLEDKILATVALRSFISDPGKKEFIFKVNGWSMWITKKLDLFSSFPKIHGWSLWFALCNAFSHGWSL
ncbi:putative armadillo-like helical protein [Helianthus anomalus]